MGPIRYGFFRDAVAFKMLKILILLVLVSPSAWTRPLSVIQADLPPLAAGLNSRVAARASRLMQDTTGDPRFPFPNAQELAAIKKVAETLVMLGQQVIPSIIGETPAEVTTISAITEIPNDPVASN